MRYVWALYNSQAKAFISSSGYYGNETNIQGFRSKEDCEKHIAMHYADKRYKPKKMRIA